MDKKERKKNKVSVDGSSGLGPSGRILKSSVVVDPDPF